MKGTTLSLMTVMARVDQICFQCDPRAIKELPTSAIDKDWDAKYVCFNDAYGQSKCATLIWLYLTALAFPFTSNLGSRVWTNGCSATTDSKIPEFCSWDIRGRTRTQTLMSRPSTWRKTNLILSLYDTLTVINRLEIKSFEDHWAQLKVVQLVSSKFQYKSSSIWNW